MVNMLLYVSVGLIMFSYIGYVLMILFSNDKVTDSNGFDITKDMISEYDRINIIESKGYFSVYNIKRKVIKLSTKCYYGNTLGNVSLSLIEAGISILDNEKNKYIDLFRKIFNNLKILYLFPIIAIFITGATYSISDAKISIVLIMFFCVISYILYDIKSFVCFWICNNIKKVEGINKNNDSKIRSFVNKLLWVDKGILLGELIMFARCILIIFKIN